MHPVFGSLSDEVLLLATGRRVALHWIAPSSDKIVLLGELDDEGIIVILEEWLGP